MGVQSICLSNHALFFLSFHPPSCVISPTNKKLAKITKKTSPCPMNKSHGVRMNNTFLLALLFFPTFGVVSFFFRTHEIQAWTGTRKNCENNSVWPICLKLCFFLFEENEQREPIFIFAYTRWLAGWDYFFGETPTLKVSFPGAP